MFALVIMYFNVYFRGNFVKLYDQCTNKFSFEMVHGK